MLIVKRLALVIVSSLLGAALFWVFEVAELDGVFVQWEPLGKPPSGAVSIIALGQVRSTSGKIYGYAFDSSCKGWCAVDSPTTSADAESLLPLSSCHRLPSVNKFIASKAFCTFDDLGARSLTVEAISRDGSVYEWSYLSGGEWAYLVPWMAASLGASAGAILGSLIALPILFSDLIKWLRRRAQERGL